MTWLLFYIAYSLHITAACQKGPKCGQVATHSSVKSQLHGGTYLLCVYLCVCFLWVWAQASDVFAYAQPN